MFLQLLSLSNNCPCVYFRCFAARPATEGRLTGLSMTRRSTIRCPRKPPTPRRLRWTASTRSRGSETLLSTGTESRGALVGLHPSADLSWPCCDRGCEEESKLHGSLFWRGFEVTGVSFFYFGCSLIPSKIDRRILLVR